VVADTWEKLLILYMLPSSTTSYSRYGIRSYSILFADCIDNVLFLLWSWASTIRFRIFKTYLFHLLLCKNTLTVPFSDAGASTRNHVPVVIRVRANSKMFWIYTSRVVAAMKDTFVFWYFSICQNPRHSMCALYLIMAVVPDKPILVFPTYFSSHPKPATPERVVCRMRRSVFVDLVPKSMFHWDSDKAAFGIYFHAEKFTSIVSKTQEVRA